MKEVEISLKSLIFYVLLHWKSLALGIVIGSVTVGFAGSYISSTRSNASTSVSTSTNASLVYFVETESPDELISVHQTLMVMLISNDYFEYVSEMTHETVADLKKVITVSGVGAERNIISYTYEPATMHSIVINISDTSDATAELISQLTMEYIQELSTELLDRGYSHKLIFIDGFSYENEDDAESMTVVEMPVEDYGVEQTVKFGGFSKKYALIGAFLGFILVACWHFIIYVFANRLEEDDDIENTYKLYMFGLIPGKSFGKLLYKLRNLGKRTFDSKESCKFIATKIAMTAEKNKVDKLGIVGCGIQKNSGDISEQLVGDLKESGIEATIIDDPLYDECSAKTLNGMDRVVLFEKAGETIRTEIWNEIEMAKKLGVDICGMVIVGR
jgi:hypothetical protein